SSMRHCAMRCKRQPAARRGLGVFRRRWLRRETGQQSNNRDWVDARAQSGGARMKAYQMTGFQQLPEFREVDVPEPGAGEVLIKVAGAGACHSDLHLTQRPPGDSAFTLPFTRGH